MITIKQLKARGAGEGMFHIPKDADLQIRFLDDPALNTRQFFAPNASGLRGVESDAGVHPHFAHEYQRNVIMDTHTHNCMRQHFAPAVEIKTEPVPIPQHKRKRWMSEAYHKRIQKKWNKRFANRTREVAGDEVKQFVMFESLYSKLKELAKPYKIKAVINNKLY